MKSIKKYILTLAVVGGLIGGVAALTVVDPAFAINPSDEVTKGVNAAGGRGQESLQLRIKDFINVLLFLIGAISVIMIIIGGLKYVLSNGDSSQITSAKNTILYAVIGLVVALLAYAIVNFVVAQFTS